MRTKFSNVKRVLEVIDKMFLTKDADHKGGLPTHVVDTRYMHLRVCAGVWVWVCGCGWVCSHVILCPRAPGDEREEPSTVSCTPTRRPFSILKCSETGTIGRRIEVEYYACVRDRHVLRRVTKALSEDTEARKQFVALST